MKMNTILKAVSISVVFAANSANAAPVSVDCPGTASTADREFTITTDPGTAICLAYAPGNINGNNDAINQLGYVTIDKSDDNTNGIAPNALSSSGSLTSGLSGDFSFTAPAGYTNFVIAFKSGQGQLNPDWAAFSLHNGVTSGDWAISGSQALSHVNLYAQVVPVPAAVWLFGSGLLGLVGVARRKIRN